MKILAGITEYEDLSVSAEFEHQAKSEIEGLIPGSWVKIREICVAAKDLKNRQTNNKVSAIRSGLESCLSNTEKTLQAYETLPTSAITIVPQETHEKLIELTSIFSIALQKSQNSGDFQNGKVSLFYREYLATHIVKLMQMRGIEPKLNRDIDNSFSGDDTYAQILRHALELVDDGKASPVDLMRIMKQGLISE